MALALFLVVAFIYLGLASRFSERSITMPMVFLTLGMAFGALGIALVETVPEFEEIATFAELTLALLLFADASMLDLRKVTDDWQLPARLLLIGLPLTLLLGTALAFVLFPGILLGGALLIAAILAPTDAALGLPIFNNKRVPARVRRALNVESGLNDGIATPFVTLATVLLITEQGVLYGNSITQAALSILIAVGVGIGAGYLGGSFLAMSKRRGLSGGLADKLAVIVLALGCYAISIALDGNGFVAAFVGGIFFGTATRGELSEDTELTEEGATLMSLLVWTTFGSLLAGPVLFGPEADWNWQHVLYAIGSLTVIRAVPVLVALAGTGLRRDSKLIMSWFGPRGLASVVFGLLTLTALEEAGIPAEPFLAVLSWTVLLSVFAHGLSAQPLVNWYDSRLQRTVEEQMVEEMMPVQETPRRRRMLVGERAL